MRKALVALWALNAFDLLATWYAVQVTDYAVELNPFMAWAMGHGFLAFAVIKLGLLAAGTVLLRHVHRRSPRVATITTWLLAGFYGLVALGHVIGYLYMRN